MRCSLVPSVVQPDSADCARAPEFRFNPQSRLPALAGRFLVAAAFLAAATSAVVSAPAMADGQTLYTSAALSNPALPPILASAEHTQLWSTSARLRNQAVEALSVLARAPDHGLPADRYALRRLTELSTSLAEPNDEQRFNELLTAAIETYAIDLLQGLQPSAFKDRRDPKHNSRGKQTMQEQLQAAVLKGLHRSIATNRVRKFITSIEPNHNDYTQLQAALSHYRQLATRGGWGTIPIGQMLVPGVSDPRVPALRTRLAITDQQTPDAAELYDEPLVAAVKAFQTRHGLKADGKVGKSTRRALNVSVADRISQIELNMDRWRLLPKVMPANHIWVNVPEYQMHLQLDRKSVLDMRVVVGKRKWPTPMMHDELEHVVFNPYWYPPSKIALREILPKLQKDAGYLAKQRFDVLENNKPIDASQIDWSSINARNLNYRFRQRPGKGNSLGEVKFMFPNRYAVYMHDTNAKSLFDRSKRALSHGCIRLEHPEQLAAAILEWDRGWNSQKVSSAMAGSKQKYVKLGQTLPVYLVYFTASVNGDTLYFHQDIYGHDARHTADQLDAPPTLVAQVLKNQALAIAAETGPAAAQATAAPTPNTPTPIAAAPIAAAPTLAASGLRNTFPATEGAH